MWWIYILPILFIICIPICFFIRLDVTKNDSRKAKQLFNKYKKWQDGKGDGSINEIPSRHDFKYLYKKMDPSLKHIIITDYNSVGASANINLWYKFPYDFYNVNSSNNEDDIVYGILDEFKSRYNENLQLSFWLQLLKYIPSEIIGLINIDKDLYKTKKTCNIVYWLYLLINVLGIVLKLVYKF